MPNCPKCQHPLPKSTSEIIQCAQCGGKIRRKSKARKKATVAANTSTQIADPFANDLNNTGTARPLPKSKIKKLKKNTGPRKVKKSPVSIWVYVGLAGAILFVCAVGFGGQWLASSIEKSREAEAVKQKFLAGFNNGGGDGEEGEVELPDFLKPTEAGIPEPRFTGIVSELDTEFAEVTSLDESLNSVPQIETEAKYELLPLPEVENWTETLPITVSKLLEGKAPLIPPSLTPGTNENFYEFNFAESVVEDYALHDKLKLEFEIVNYQDEEQKTLSPLLADLNGPFVLYGKETLRTNSVYKKDSSSEENLAPRGDVALLDLRTGESAGDYSARIALTADRARALSPDGTYFIGASTIPEFLGNAKPNELEIWRVNELEAPAGKLSLPGEPVWAHFISNTEVSILCQTANGFELELFDVTTGNLRTKVALPGTKSGHAFDAATLCFERVNIPHAVSSCGKLIALSLPILTNENSTSDFNVFFVDTAEAKVIGTLTRAPDAMAFSRDSQRLCLAYQDDQSTIVDIRDGSTGKTVRGTEVKTGNLKVRHIHCSPINENVVILSGSETAAGTIHGGRYVLVTSKPECVETAPVARWFKDGPNLELDYKTRFREDAKGKRSLMVAGTKSRLTEQQKSIKVGGIGSVDPDAALANTDRSSVEQVSGQPPESWTAVPSIEAPVPSKQISDLYDFIQSVPEDDKFVARWGVQLNRQKLSLKWRIPGESPSNQAVVTTKGFGSADPLELQLSRFCHNQSGELFALTSGKHQHTVLNIYAISGFNYRFKIQSSIVPYGLDKSIDDVCWGNGSRLFTVGDGRFTAWDANQSKAIFELRDGYQKPIYPSPSGDWIAASRGRSIDIISATDGKILARIKDTSINQVLDLNVSPLQEYLAVSLLDANNDERVFTYALASGKRLELPIRISVQDQPDQVHSTAFLFWDGPTRLIRGLDGSAKVQVFDITHESLAQMSGEEYLQVRRDEFDYSAIKSKPLAVKVGLPNLAQSEKLAGMIAQRLQLDGFKIGPGGNVLTVTAVSRMPKPQNTDPKTTLPIAGQRKSIPSVEYTLVYSDMDENEIHHTRLEAKFRKRGSQYLEGEKQVGNKTEETWKFPADYVSAIINEIIDRGIGIGEVSASSGGVSDSVEIPLKVEWTEY